MLMLSAQSKVYLATEPIDMRKSFNGLYQAVVNQLDQKPLEGGLFVFSNKSLNRIKILYWDGTGLWVFAKRLEKGRFSWPKGLADKKKVSLAPEALQMLLSGIDLKDGCQKAWYER